MIILQADLLFYWKTISLQKQLPTSTFSSQIQTLFIKMSPLKEGGAIAVFIDAPLKTLTGVAQVAVGTSTDDFVMLTQPIVSHVS